MVPDPAQSRQLSADLLAFITPLEFHPLWGAWARVRGQVFPGSPAEHQVFAGFGALVLAACGAHAGLRPTRRQDALQPSITSRGARPAARPGIPEQAASARGEPASCRYTGFLLLCLVVFGVLALGPVLHIAGRTALLPGGAELSLPYGWLARTVPFMDITRSVSRFDIMVMLVIAVLAAQGLRWVLSRGATGRAAGAFLAMAIVFEFLPVPYPVSQPDTPAWYQTLASDTRPGAVLNLPMNWDRPGYLLYQTVHGKPLSVAYISRDDPRTLTERIPVLQHLRHLGPDIIDFDLGAQGIQVLDDLGVRWVVLDRYKMPGEPERGYNERTAATIFGSQAPVYRDERLTVYEVSRPATRAPYLVLGDGWGGYDGATRSRPFTGSATVIVQAPAGGEADLWVMPQAGNAVLDMPKVGDGYRLRVSLVAGANAVRLRTVDPGARAFISTLAVRAIAGGVTAPAAADAADPPTQ
jgi:hypothetical protein